MYWIKPSSHRPLRNSENPTSNAPARIKKAFGMLKKPFLRACTCISQETDSLSGSQQSLDNSNLSISFRASKRIVDKQLLGKELDDNRSSIEDINIEQDGIGFKRLELEQYIRIREDILKNDPNLENLDRKEITLHSRGRIAQFALELHEKLFSETLSPSERYITKNQLKQFEDAIRNINDELGEFEQTASNIEAEEMQSPHSTDRYRDIEKIKSLLPQRVPPRKKKIKEKIFKTNKLAPVNSQSVINDRFSHEVEEKTKDLYDYIEIGKNLRKHKFIEQDLEKFSSEEQLILKRGKLANDAWPLRVELALFSSLLPFDLNSVSPESLPEEQLEKIKKLKAIENQINEINIKLEEHGGE